LGPSGSNSILFQSLRPACHGDRCSDPRRRYALTSLGSYVGLRLQALNREVIYPFQDERSGARTFPLIDNSRSVDQDMTPVMESLAIALKLDVPCLMVKSKVQGWSHYLLSTERSLHFPSSSPHVALMTLVFSLTKGSSWYFS
jgi:hypothetical protein